MAQRDPGLEGCVGRGGKGLVRKQWVGQGSKQRKNIALARKLSAYSACQQQSSSIPIQHFSCEG